jgi:hypothetical protein
MNSHKLDNNAFRAGALSTLVTRGELPGRLFVPPGAAQHVAVVLTSSGPAASCLVILDKIEPTRLDVSMCSLMDCIVFARNQTSGGGGGGGARHEPLLGGAYVFPDIASKVAHVQFIPSRSMMILVAESGSMYVFSFDHKLLQWTAQGKHMLIPKHDYGKEETKSVVGAAVFISRLDVVLWSQYDTTTTTTPANNNNEKAVLTLRVCRFFFPVATPPQAGHTVSLLSMCKDSGLVIAGGDGPSDVGCWVVARSGATPAAWHYNGDTGAFVSVSSLEIARHLSSADKDKSSGNGGSGGERTVVSVECGAVDDCLSSCKIEYASCGDGDGDGDGDGKSTSVWLTYCSHDIAVSATNPRTERKAAAPPNANVNILCGLEYTLSDDFVTDLLDGSFACDNDEGGEKDETVAIDNGDNANAAVCCDRVRESLLEAANREYQEERDIRQARLVSRTGVGGKEEEEEKKEKGELLDWLASLDVTTLLPPNHSPEPHQATTATTLTHLEMIDLASALRQFTDTSSAGKDKPSLDSSSSSSKVPNESFSSSSSSCSLETQLMRLFFSKPKAVLPAVWTALVAMRSVEINRGPLSIGSVDGRFLGHIAITSTTSSSDGDSVWDVAAFSCLITLSLLSPDARKAVLQGQAIRALVLAGRVVEAALCLREWGGYAREGAMLRERAAVCVHHLEYLLGKRCDDADTSLVTAHSLPFAVTTMTTESSTFKQASMMRGRGDLGPSQAVEWDGYSLLARARELVACMHQMK